MKLLCLISSSPGEAKHHDAFGACPLFFISSSDSDLLLTYQSTIAKLVDEVGLLKKNRKK